VMKKLKERLPILVVGDDHSRGGCGGQCVTYGCTQARILRCHAIVCAK
jgi:hypothetical protein